MILCSYKYLITQIEFNTDVQSVLKILIHMQVLDHNGHLEYTERKIKGRREGSCTLPIQ